MQPKKHWDQIYASQSAEATSWYQPHAEQSLRLIRETGVSLDAPIIDVGGGTSTLVDDLLDAAYANLSVLDLSSRALAVARKRLGEHAHKVHWIEADITQVQLPHQAFAVWHDRAVFHFLVTPAVRQAYITTLRQAVQPGGHVIVATFAKGGPDQCSGLPVMQYSAEELHAEFGASFQLLHHEHEKHHTPSGTVQMFLYCYYRIITT